MQDYIGLLVLVAVAAVICGAMVTLSWVLGPKKVTPYKNSPYECGVEPVGDIHERFPIKFYLVAIVFILFDIEVVFLWAWMTVFRSADTQFMITSFFAFLSYMATFVVGYVYVIRVGAINWDETTALAVEKLGEGEPEPGSLQPEVPPVGSLAGGHA